MALRRSSALSAFLVALCVIALVGFATEPGVFIVAIADAPAECGDGRPVVAKALGNGRVRLNAEPEATVDEVVSRIHEVMRYRAERVVYVAAEPGVAWRDVLALVDRVWSEAEVISIITPKIEELARRRHCLVPSRGPYQKLPRHMKSVR